MSNIPGVSWQWIAGFIDGEGCIRVKRAAAPHGYVFQPSLSITNTHKVTIEAIHKFFGTGSIHTRQRGENNKAISDILVTSLAFARVMPRIIPNLITKRDRALLAYYITATRGKEARARRNIGRVGKSPVRAPITNEEQFIYEAVKAMNHRGRGEADRMNRVEKSFGVRLHNVLEKATVFFNTQTEMEL